MSDKQTCNESIELGQAVAEEQQKAPAETPDTAPAK